VLIFGAGLSRRDVCGTDTDRGTLEIRFCKTDISIEEVEKFYGFIFV
jgi:hypothetical protein